MNEAEYQELLEASWRGALSPAEVERLQAGLDARPELRARWLADTGLDHLLDRMPDAPVPSNFTALVLQEARRQSATMSEPLSRPFLVELWTRLFARPAIGVAWVAVMVAMCWLAVYQAHNSSEQRRNELADFFRAAAPSDPVLLQDFDAIRLLPEDEELFAVLSK